MKRTKPKAGNVLPSSSKNVGTQTEKFDSLIEVAKLEEQVRLLTLENNVLRKHTKTSNKPGDVVRYKLLPVAQHTTPKTNTEKSSCGCKGNCGSRICGCVKKNNKCSPLCKCDDKMCQNQKAEYNQENKENSDITDITGNQSRKKNKTPEPLNSNRGLFSPDTRESYKNVEEHQFSDIYFNFNKNNIVIKGSNSTDPYSIKNIKFNKEEENTKQQESIEKVMYVMDPMKPKHQLSRTPPKKFEEPLKMENTIQSQLHSTPIQERVISPLKDLDIEEEKIDWEEHTAQLIPCKKCKRTFLPDRIKKHEACCKKI